MMVALAVALVGLWDAAVASNSSFCAWAGVTCAAGTNSRATAMCARPCRHRAPLPLRSALVRVAGLLLSALRRAGKR